MELTEIKLAIVTIGGTLITGMVIIAVKGPVFDVGTIIASGIAAIAGLAGVELKNSTIKQ